MPNSSIAARRRAAPAAAATAAAAAEPNRIDRVARAADALTRTAIETIRLRQRYACLVERGAMELEQRGARRLLCIGDDLLAEAVAVYGQAAGSDRDHLDEEWWHRANALWLACREYLRRHAGCDEAQGELDRHDEATLGRLTIDFDLEASALLFLQQAIDGVRNARPSSMLHSAPLRIPA